MLKYLLIAVLLLQSLLVANPADLDISFSIDGKVTTSIGSSSAQAQSIAIQNDDKIVVAGSAWMSNHYDFALARYNPDGSLDTSFDGDGRVTTAVGSFIDYASSMTIQNDGKIVVVGHSSHNFALVRYNPDGSLDTSFSNDGKVTTHIGSGNSYALSVAIQNDDKIVVAGSSYNGSNVDFALVRYNPNGLLDASFDGDGIVATTVGSGGSAQSVTIQNDGKIVVAGNAWIGSNSDFALVRYNTDGSLDTSFNWDGMVTTTIGSNDDYAQSVAVQSDGKIVAAGYSNDGNDDFALVRYNPDGSLDLNFNNDGKVTTPIGSGYDRGYSVAIQNNSKIIVAGNSWNGSNEDFALVCYNPNGSLDTSFSSDGKVTTEIGNGADSGRSVAIQNDGKIVVAGDSQNGSEYDFAVVRYKGTPSTLAPIYYLLQ